MTEGHTRGPWKYGWETSAREWALVTNSAGSVVANVNSESGPDAQSVPATRKMPAEANARLIAASPELLEALRQCQRVLHDLTRGDKSLSTLHIYTHAVEAEAKARARTNKESSDV